MKRLICLLMAMAFPLALFGCSSEGGGKTTNDAPVTNNCHETGYPIAEKPVTLTIMIKDYYGLTDYEDMAINQYMKDKFNIAIDWIVCPGGEEVNSRVTLAYTSGTMPDIFMGMAPLGYSFHGKYIKQGLIQPLDELIDKYGVNTKKMFEEQKEAKYLCTGEDGKIYMLPMVRNSTTNNVRYGQKFFINKTWLDQLGLEMPKTVDEFTKVLRAFKTSDPNGNGQADEIPLSLYNGTHPSIFGPFGLSLYWQFMDISDEGKVRMAPEMDEYRNALIYYRDLLNEGLIDEDWLLQQQMNVQEKASDTVPLVGVFTALDSQEIVSAERSLKDYVVMPPLQNAEGTGTWTYTVTEDIWPDWFLITKTCKYPEIAMRLCDFFYSPEGTRTALQGPPGEKNAWNFDEDGKAVALPQNRPEGTTTGNWMAKLTPGYPIPHYAGDAYNEMVRIPEDEMTLEDKCSLRDQTDGYELYDSVKPKNVFFKFSLTEEEINTLAGFENELYAYIHDSRGKFLTGEMSLENDWDAYRANLKKLKVDEQVAIYQAAYERYLAWQKANQ